MPSMALRRFFPLRNIEGIKTTIPLHKRVFADPVFRSGKYNTGYLEKLDNK